MSSDGVGVLFSSFPQEDNASAARNSKNTDGLTLRGLVCFIDSLTREGNGRAVDLKFKIYY